MRHPKFNVNTVGILLQRDPLMSLLSGLLVFDLDHTGKVKTFHINIEEDKKIKVTFNQAWFASIDRGIFINVTKKAIYSFIYYHWLNENGSTDKEKVAWKVAKDICINELLDVTDSGYCLEPNEFTVANINEKFNLNLEPKKDALYYYQHIKIVDLVDESLGDCNGGNGVCQDSITGSSEMTQEQLLSAVAAADRAVEAVQEMFSGDDGSADGQGILPNLGSGKIEIEFAKPVIKWRGLLAKCIIGAQGNRLIQTSTKSRPDRREVSPYGKRQLLVGSVLIVVDTSGSMVDTETMSKIFTEIDRLAMNYKVYLIQADAKIASTGVYKKGDAKNFYDIKGCGGTDFTDSIKHFNESEHKVCIYFTDSYGICSVEPVDGKTVIWVLTEKASAEHLHKMKNSKVISMN